MSSSKTPTRRRGDHRYDELRPVRLAGILFLLVAAFVVLVAL